ncbi:hypothetical protein [Pectobacterium carotovorum]|uniref:hypothetical protein n=1 Tax=Pectobacterium carotovorum TaxID=554 RepID=UPI00027E0B60|nr:hypothetical protein [Pectobacterium carotovorum]AFR03279.1 hypothetical protein PCC21_018760 [Pectobacterium carotovorum subsp. carotovorum PCC21]
MALTNERLIDSLRHNRKLLDEIYQSGKSQYYNTDIIHDAIDSILDELRRRRFPV